MVAAASGETVVAAVKPPKKNKNQGGNGNNSNKPTPSSSSSTPKPTTKPDQGNKGTRHPTAKGDNDKLCRMHFKWGENSLYCAAPWKCPMKAVYKAPQ